MKIQGVRFNQSIHLGKSLDLQSYVAEGQMIQGDPVKLSRYDDVFLQMDFTKGEYSQLIPWAQVACLFWEPSDTNAAKQRSKG